MQQSRRFYVLFSVLLYLLQAEGADKYTDENRPYEFGFTIDGEQHRHEKKDENGLIMGEFGFITADGVYHVTVYATDENGNFKILSMKNIRVKPYPTSSAVAPPTRKGNSLTFPPSQQASGSQEISPQQQQQQPVSLEPPRKSCSHCSLPTTSTQLPQLTNNQQYPEVPSVSQNYPQAFGVSQNDPAGLTNFKYPLENDGQQQNFEIQQNYPENQQNYKQGSDFNRQSTPQRFGAQPENPHQEIGAQTYPQSGNTAEQNYPQQSNEAIQNYPQQNNEAIPNYPQQSNEAIQNYPQQSNEAMQNYPQQGIDAAQNYPQQGGDNTEQNLPSGERNPKQYNQVPQQQFGIPTQVQTPQSGSNGAGFGILPDEQFPAKPTLISAQMQIVDKNTDINHLSPGEKQGLPNGLTKNDMMQLLYTFNYTVGFHGHHEEGYTNGAKVGYYYVTARNGVRTRIDYVADEKGFRPKITQEVLDLLSDEVPKPETEKDEKYGLKGYEFKWLYYPVGSKRR